MSRNERVLAHCTEAALYLLMFAIPVTGLWLVVSDDDSVLVAHVRSHIAFFVALASHVGLVLVHRVLHRGHLLRRMT